MYVRISTNIEALYGESGIYPMKVMRKINMIKYWIKILKTDKPSTLFEIFTLIKEDAENGKHYKSNNWAHQITCLLDHIGMTNIWRNQFINLPDLNTTKLRLTYLYKQSWYAKINNSTRIQT